MNYRLSNTAKEDLMRIYRYGVYKFGSAQAEQYFENFFLYFDRIAENPYAFEAVDF
ncbi:MAG: plasmid stabilization protein, partial [Leeuwenhoekiella sp.]|nr:plasmid stabilization protein [Leeuwenhoekiella sp.]